jgi:hypothetical protein
MSFKTTYVLFGTLFTILVAFALTQIFGLRKPGEADDYAFPSLHGGTRSKFVAKDITTVVIERNKPEPEKFVFVRQAQGWRMTEPYSFVAKEEEIERLLGDVANAKKQRADLSSSLAEYELEHPHYVVTLKNKKEDERDLVLKIGAQSPGGESTAVVYVVSSELPRTPMAIKKSDLKPVFLSPHEWASLDLLHCSSLNTSRLALSAPERQPVEFTKAEKEGRWSFVHPSYGDAEVDGDPTATGDPKPVTGMKELFDALAAIRLADKDHVATLQATDKELAEFGVEDRKAATLRAEIKRTSENLVGGAGSDPVDLTLLVGKKIEKKDDAEELYYVRLESDRLVGKAPAKYVASVLRVLDDPSILRNRDLVNVDASKVDAIDVQNAKGVFKLRKFSVPEAWKLFEGGKVEEGDGVVIRSLLDTLGAKRQIKRFLDDSKPDAEYGFDKPSAVLSLWTAGILKEDPDAKKEDKKDDAKKEETENGKKDDAKKEEPKAEQPVKEPKLKDEKPTVKLTFGKIHEGQVYVRREVGKETTWVAVPESVLTAVNQGPLAFMDRGLPSFVVGDVKKLVLTRGSETLEASREKSGETTEWKLKKPLEAKADQQGVEKVLETLASLKADKLVAAKADDLEVYGLKKPRCRAVVTLDKGDGKSEDRIYDFGKEGEGGFYGKQGQRDLIFVVGPLVVEALERTELQDTTVFAFSMDKVKEVKLVGWKEVYKSTFTLAAVRKGSKQWEPTLPPDFALDAEQLDSFVEGLSNLKADRYVVRKTGQKPEHKLDAKDRQLQVELTIEGEVKPMTLTIGAFDQKQNGYYATSSTLPGDVFVLAQTGPREKLLSKGAAYFSPGKPEEPK